MSLVQALAQVLPVLKNGTNFSSTETEAPVRGLRPERGARCFTVKAPNRSAPRGRHAKGFHDLVEDDVDDALDVTVVRDAGWLRQSSE
jgi:hypothetical protein